MDFKDVKKILNFDQNEVCFGEMPIILMPLVYYGKIIDEIEKTAGAEATQKIFYNAAFDGAYPFIMQMLCSGKSPEEVIFDYHVSMRLRGWGSFELLDLSVEKGECRCSLVDSSIALALKPKKLGTCAWAAGAMAGTLQAILDSQEQDIKVKGQETKCIAKGDSNCEILVTPYW